MEEAETTSADKSKSKLPVAIVVSIAIFFGFHFAVPFIASIRHDNWEEEKFRQHAEIFNQNLPMQVTPKLRLVRCEAGPGTLLTYTFTHVGTLTDEDKQWLRGSAERHAQTANLQTEKRVSVRCRCLDEKDAVEFECFVEK